jgi:hypothetical protein
LKTLNAKKAKPCSPFLVVAGDGIELPSSAWQTRHRRAILTGEYRIMLLQQGSDFRRFPVFDGAPDSSSQPCIRHYCNPHPRPVVINSTQSSLKPKRLTKPAGSSAGPLKSACM